MWRITWKWAKEERDEVSKRAASASLEINEMDKENNSPRHSTSTLSTAAPYASDLPEKRWGHGMVSVSLSNSLWDPFQVSKNALLFGGYDIEGYCNDLYLLRRDGSEVGSWQWKKIDTLGRKPHPRSNHSMITFKQHVIVYGGNNEHETILNDIVVLNLDTIPYIWWKPEIGGIPPSARRYQAGCKLENKFVMMGGQSISGNDLNDIHVLDLNYLSKGTVRWIQKHQLMQDEETKPSSRHFHTLTEHENGHFAILFGGCCQNMTHYLNDMYILSLQVEESGSSCRTSWVTPQLHGTPPAARWGHSMINCGAHFILFGGRNTKDLSDLHVLTIDSMKANEPDVMHWSTLNTSEVFVSLPSPRRRHSSICLLQSEMMVFGGYSNEFFNDLHTLPLNKCLPEEQNECQTLVPSQKNGKTGFPGIGSEDSPPDLCEQHLSSEMIEEAVQKGYTRDMLNACLAVICSTGISKIEMGVGFLTYLSCYEAGMKQMNAINSKQREGLQEQLHNLEEEIQLRKEAEMCIICSENPRSLVLEPCGHFCFCSTCFHKIRSTGQCPICRIPWTRVLSVYTS